MLTIILFDSQQIKPQQQWRFDKESIIRVGRIPENQVVLQNDVVSGIHIEIHQIHPQQWELISKGRNGTFVNDNAVQQIILTDGLQVQLAKGGPILKFELQLELQKQIAPPPAPDVPTVASATPLVHASTVAIEPKQAVPSASVQAPSVQIQQQIQQLTQEKNQLQLQLNQTEAARAELETILAGLNAQFPPAFFSQGQQEVTKRLGEIQRLKTDLQAEIARWQRLAQQQPQSQQLQQSEYESLFKILSANSNYLEEEQKALEDFQERMKKVEQFLNQLQKHLQANKHLSQQLPTLTTNGTRVDNLIEVVTKQLTELDLELGRIHELHLLNSAKQTFSL